MFRNFFSGSILELFFGDMPKKPSTAQERFKELVAELCDYAQVTYVSIEDYDIKQEALEAISYDVASQYSIIPLEIDTERILIAMVNPLDVRAIDEIKALTNLKVDIVVTTYSDFEAALSKYYYDCSVVAAM